MPSDTTGPTGRDDPRRPVIIDLPAENVDRRPTDETGMSVLGEASDTPVSGETTYRAESASAAGGTSSDEDFPTQGSEASMWSTSAAGAEFEESRDGPAGVAAASPESPPARRRTPFLPLLAAALLGGVVGAGGIYGLDRAGVLRSGPAEAGGGPDVAAQIARLDTEVAQLRQAAPPPGETVDIAPLREQISGLEQSLAELRQQPANGPADGALLAEVQTRLARIEETAATLQSAPPAAGGPDPALEARLTELSGQVEALRASSARPDVGPQVTELNGRMDEMGTRLEDVARRVSALAARPPVDLAPLEGTVAELRGQVEQLNGRLESAPKEERVAALEGSLAETTRKADLASALGPAVAADALAAAVQSGAPFASELAALRTLGLDQAAIAALETQAQAGLPTIAALRTDFETRIDGIDLSAPVPASAGPLDRLVQSAKGLVEVRPVNPVAGTEPAAVVARIRGALEAGDLRAAHTEWNALPENVKAPTAEWARSVEARAAADEVVARLRTEALSRLASQG